MGGVSGPPLKGDGHSDDPLAHPSRHGQLTLRRPHEHYRRPIRRTDPEQRILRKQRHQSGPEAREKSIGARDTVEAFDTDGDHSSPLVQSGGTAAEKSLILDAQSQRTLAHHRSRTADTEPGAGRITW